MDDKQPRKIIRMPAGGIVGDVTQRIKLIWRLMGDRRVSPFLKLLPIASLLYLVFPGLLPLNPVDDALVLWLGSYLFVELCPDEVVREHMRKLQQTVTAEVKDAPQPAPASAQDDVVEGEVREVEPVPSDENRPENAG